MCTCLGYFYLQTTINQIIKLYHILSFNKKNTKAIEVKVLQFLMES